MFNSSMQRARSGEAGSEPVKAPMTLTDARADGRRRTVRLSRERVTIDRSFRGIAMRLSIPIGAYRGVCVGCRPSLSGGLGYEIRLEHRDPELSVSLAEALDESDIWADWQSWARFFNLPTLIERNEGMVEWGHAPDRIEVGPLPSRGAPPRRSKRRRAPFLARRFAQPGAPRMVHREPEMIARD